MIIKRIERIIKSWDLFFSLIFTGLFVYFYKHEIPANIVKEIASIAISILSIIFSVYFAALAVLIASGDDDFVKFLQEEEAYTEIIWSYKYTLIIIFFALLFSFALFIMSLFALEKQPPIQYSQLIVGPYFFSVIYALFCTFESAKDAILYAKYRSMYIKVVKKKELTPRAKDSK